MRYLFLSLIVLNILYALWQLQVRTPVTTEGLEGSVKNAPQSQSSAPPQVIGAAQPAPAPASAPALCVTLGRFDDADEAGQLRQRLLVLGIDALVQAREVVVGTDYWLVMPVMGGERHAMAQLSAMQEQGLDSFLITRGEMAGHLSLGVFARADHAELRREQLQTLGYDVAVHALSKKKQQFGVQLGSEARRLVDQAMLSRLRADFPSLQHQYQSCADVANTAAFP